MDGTERPQSRLQPLRRVQPDPHLSHPNSRCRHGDAARRPTRPFGLSRRPRAAVRVVAGVQHRQRVWPGPAGESLWAGNSPGRAAGSSPWAVAEECFPSVTARPGAERDAEAPGQAPLSLGLVGGERALRLLPSREG